MKEWFEIKMRGILGFDKNDQKEITILGRRVRWCDWGIEYEGDPKYREKLLKHFGLGRMGGY